MCRLSSGFSASAASETPHWSTLVRHWSVVAEKIPISRVPIWPISWAQELSIFDHSSFPSCFCRPFPCMFSALTLSRTISEAAGSSFRASFHCGSASLVPISFRRKPGPVRGSSGFLSAQNSGRLLVLTTTFGTLTSSPYFTPGGFCGKRAS